MNLRPKHLIALGTIMASLVVLASETTARCLCRCVNGEVVPICSNTLELPPICGPRVCPIVPPSIAPLKLPSLPPLGTTRCSQQQVYNPYSDRYEWKEICS